jgi:hypothetical protein
MPMETRLKGSNNRAIQSGLPVLGSSPTDHHRNRLVAEEVLSKESSRVIRDGVRALKPALTWHCPRRSLTIECSSDQAVSRQLRQRVRKHLKCRLRLSARPVSLGQDCSALLELPSDNCRTYAAFFLQILHHNYNHIMYFEKVNNLYIHFKQYDVDVRCQGRRPSAVTS